MTAEKPRRLGRGLEALIPGANLATTPSAAPDSDLQRIPISRIRPNPYQPRYEFDPTDLAELQASMKASGLLQPITVRRKGDAFELIAGERRLRAATNLGWTEILAVIRDFDEQTMLILALVENLQRADLNAIEEARGYKRLIDEFQYTQQQVADAVGKDRTTITNLLRMLGLPAPVQQMVIDGQLSAGHARALLALPPSASALEFATLAVAESISVRELEQRVRALTTPGANPPSRDGRAGKEGRRELDPAARRIVDDLRRYLQTDVRLNLSGEAAGSITLSFYSNEDLDRLLDLILREYRRDF